MNRIIETYTTSSEYDIRIVGGAVRDLLQDKTPKDIDFATTALPDQIIELCQQNNVRHYLTGFNDVFRIFILLTKTTAVQNEAALSYRSVRGLYFLAVVFVRSIGVLVFDTKL